MAMNSRRKVTKNKETREERKRGGKKRDLADELIRGYILFFFVCILFLCFGAMSILLVYYALREERRRTLSGWLRRKGMTGPKAL